MLDEHLLSFSGISGILAKIAASFTKVLFSVLSEMKPSLKVLKLYTAPSAAECSL